MWGTNRWNWKKDWPGLHAFQPTRLGTNSDWAEIFTDNGRTFLRNTSGEVWAYPPFFSDEESKLALNKQITFGKAAFLPTNHWHSAFWCSAHNSSGFIGGICDDGTFRELADWQKASHGSKWEPASRNIQIGADTNWLAAVRGNDDSVVSLKADGALWRWRFENAPDINPRGFSANRFSEHTDWVAIAQMMGGVVTLAADGGLWLWRFDPEYYSYHSDGVPALLAYSRKPQFLGNIFAKPD
jgi:hypothetical protein